MSIPIKEGCELLRGVIAEVKEGENGPQKHEYTMVALAPLRTRVQAFLEMME